MRCDVMRCVSCAQIPSLLRIGFIPLFIGSVYWGGIFQNDVFTAVVMLFFSLTNGYIASLGMMYGPARVRDDCVRTHAYDWLS